MVPSIPDHVGKDDYCIVTEAPDFTGFVALELGEAITERDGFDNEWALILSDFPLDGAVWQDIDDSIAEAVPFYLNAARDTDPELPHAIEAVAAALAYNWNIINGVSNAANFLNSSPPSTQDSKLTLAQLPDASTLDLTGLEAIITADVLARLPKTPGGTLTGVATVSTTPGPKGGFRGGTTGGGGQTAVGAAGLISVSADAVVTWNTSPTLAQPIEVYVSKPNEEIQLFGSGQSGAQSAPWLLTSTGSTQFELYSNKSPIDSVTVSGINL